MKTMPNLNLNQTLTNQQLLDELDQRIGQGTIAWKVNSEIKPANLPAKLFKASFNQESQQLIKKGEVIEETNSSSQLFNSETLLWMALLALTILFAWTKSFTFKTTVDLVDKSLGPMNNN